MADFHDMRSRMRETSYEPESSGSSGLSFWIVTVCAVAAGFAVVMFAPRLYTAQRTAMLPAFKETQARPESGQPASPTASIPPAGPMRYANKSADEMGRIADAVCVPPRVGATNIAYQSEQLHCLLTEAPARYCSAVQRSKITAAIINHFRIVEHAATVAKVEVEPRVLVAIENLIRAGYLLRPQRDDIGTSVPRAIKERFDRVVGSKLPCPDPPWWAIWK